MMTGLLFPAPIKLLEEKPLTLEQALAMTLSDHPEIRAAMQRIRQAKGQRGQEATPPSPVLGFVRENIPNRGTVASDPVERQWTLSQSFDFPLAYVYRHKGKTAAIRALEHDLDTLRRTLIAQLKTAFSMVLYTREQVSLARQNITLAQTLVDAVHLRLQAGEASGMEEIRANLALSEAQNDLREVELAHHLSRYAFFDAMGLDPAHQSYSIQIPGNLTPFEVAVSQQEILEQMEVLPQMQAARERVRQGTMLLRERKSLLLPSWALEWFRQDRGDGFNHHGFAISLTVPLWAPIKERGALSDARAQREEADCNLQSIRLGVKREVEEAWHHFEISRDIIREYQKNIAEKSRTLLDMAQEAYQMGAIGIMEMLDSQRAYLDSRRRFLRALHEYHDRVIQMERYWHQPLVFPQAHPSAP